MVKAFQSTQRQFTRRIRYGDDEIIPDNVSLERMKVYQELLFNNVFDVFANCFPVLTDLLPNELSRDFIEKFLSTKHCKTPYFYQLPKEILDFMQDYTLDKYPFMTQLAHYEWLELDLELYDEEPVEVYDSELCLDKALVFNPAIKLSQYDYDVENICRDYLPNKKIPTFLLLHRDDDYHVSFIKLNELSFDFIKQLKTGLTLEQALPQLVEKNPDIEKQDLINGAIALVNEWQGKGIVLGCKL